MFDQTKISNQRMQTVHIEFSTVTAPLDRDCMRREVVQQHDITASESGNGAVHAGVDADDGHYIRRIFSDGIRTVVSPMNPYRYMNQA